MSMLGSQPSSRLQARDGISLLEVVLALAILAMSTAILAQIARTATDNGLLAHRLATAQILAESKMAEVVTGAIALQGATGWTPINDTVPSGVWYYQIQQEQMTRKDMIGVRLAITDQIGMDEGKELFYLVRWMIDPALGLDTLPAATQTSPGMSSGGAAGAVRGVQ
jgi:type II secretory pathway pseudopilin PulG